MKNKVHLICNAHLDPVWQWRWTEGCSEALATFRNAVDILTEYPELIFNHNEAVLYQWTQKYDAGLFHEIRELVNQKRWFIAGGWFLQPDLNLPPRENLIRHIRFGRDYFKSEFGAEPKVAYNFDSFGHPAGLPQLLRDFGYELYIHQRPEKELLHLPGSFYLWKGLNNCSIPAYRIEIGLYHTERNNITDRMAAATELALRLNRDVALFWGLGDHGGGATRLDLDRIRTYTSSENRVDFVHSTTDRFYEAIAPMIPTLPAFEGSLQRVFTGCYTSIARVKRKAVEASAAALQCEKLADINSNDNAVAAIHEIWQDVLFNDFHDILPGSCTHSAELDALDLYGRAMENIRRLNMQSITAINHLATRLPAHIPVTIFNSNHSISTFPVEFECMSDYRPFWEGEYTLKLFDRQGNEIPCQEEQAEARLPFHRWRRKIAFLAHEMPFGIHHLYLKPEARTQNPSAQTRQNHNLTPLSFIVLADTADSWGTHTWSWRKTIGQFETEQEEQVIEHGPIRTIYESTHSFHHSKIIVQRICYADWPVTEYILQIHWNEKQARLKAVIPVNPKYQHVFAQIPGGYEEFPADAQEHVHGTWMTLTTQNQPIPDTPNDTASLHIAHNGLHGFDFDGSEVRLSILRSAAYCHEQGYPLDNNRSHQFMDLGLHEIKMAIWENNPQPEAVAEWLNAPPLVWPHLPIGYKKN